MDDVEQTTNYVHKHIMAYSQHNEGIKAEEGELADGFEYQTCILSFRRSHDAAIGIRVLLGEERKFPSNGAC